MYSFDDLYLNFRTAFDRVEIQNFKTDRILLLGAGMLSVPYILEKIHQKKFICKAVDIDPVILELAQYYAMPKLKSNIELICTDAYQFIIDEKEKYDLIVVDIFIDDLVPSKFESLDFLNTLKNILKKDGLLMYNRMSQNDSALKNTEIYYNQCFKQVYINSELLRLKGNSMLLGNYHSKKLKARI